MRFTRTVFLLYQIERLLLSNTNHPTQRQRILYDDIFHIIMTKQKTKEFFLDWSNYHA